MAAVAYIRVSTDKQDADNQRLEILRLANDRALGQVRFVEEVVSGRKSWRDREIASVLDSLKAGDALVVAELSRLGRSMLEIMEILSIATQRGIKVLPQRQAGRSMGRSSPRSWRWPSRWPRRSSGI